ncbi:MAG: DUF4430 domain-containing protein [bacterium]|jgi:hypothetical protein|nr:DUF4430 domain-containing protein [Bacillota bacterium]HHW55723.1 DUF4430 domain-containing protein [Bacillota bacterium]
MRERKLGLLVLLLVLVLTAGCSGPAGEGGGNPAPAAAPSGEGSLGEKGVDEGLAVPPEEPEIGEKMAAEETITASREEPAEEKPAQKEPELPPVRLLVTRGYGRQVLLEREVSLPEKLSVMDLLAGEAAVTRSYGGGFVQGIDGLEATGGGWGGGRQDWFYYVNGVFSPVGAADYILGPGDVVWWDYHHWSAGLVFPAVVGCFPEPFVNGFLGRGEGVMILCPAGYEDLARKLQESLLAAGAGQVTLGEPEEALLVERSCPTIVLGRWEELQEVGWLVELNRNHQRAGLSFHFTPYGLELVDYRGQVARRVEESAGVIGATGAGSGDPNPLWLVVGNDRTGLERAVQALLQEPETIRGLFGAALVGDEVIALPLM